MLRVRAHTSSRGSGQCGIAMVEFAWTMAILFPVVLGAWSLVDLMWSWNQLNRTIDAEISAYDGYTRPFRSRIDNEGNFQLVRRDDAFDDELRRMAIKIEAAIIAQASGGTVNQGAYRVLVNLVVAQVNPGAGNITSVNEHNVVGQAGAMELDGHAISATALVEELLRDQRANSQAGSLYAVPTGAYGRNSANNYLPAAYFLTVRVYQDIEGTFGGSGLSLVGRSTKIFSGKAMTLRGGVDL